MKRKVDMRTPGKGTYDGIKNQLRSGMKGTEGRTGSKARKMRRVATRGYTR